MKIKNTINLINKNKHKIIINKFNKIIKNKLNEKEEIQLIKEHICDTKFYFTTKEELSNKNNIDIEKLYNIIKNKYENLYCKNNNNYTIIDHEKNLNCDLKIFLKNNTVRIQIASKEELKYKLHHKSEELRKRLKKIEINFDDFEFI